VVGELLAVGMTVPPRQDVAALKLEAQPTT
jgi:hypothetical protein